MVSAAGFFVSIFVPRVKMRFPFDWVRMLHRGPARTHVLSSIFGSIPGRIINIVNHRPPARSQFISVLIRWLAIGRLTVRFGFALRFLISLRRILADDHLGLNPIRPKAAFLRL